MQTIDARKLRSDFTDEQKAEALRIGHIEFKSVRRVDRRVLSSRQAVILVAGFGVGSKDDSGDLGARNAVRIPSVRRTVRCQKRTPR